MLSTTKLKSTEVESKSAIDVRMRLKLHTAHSIVFQFELPADMSKATKAQLTHGSEIVQLLQDDDITGSFGNIVMSIASLNEKVSDEQVDYFLNRHKHALDADTFAKKSAYLKATLAGKEFNQYVELSVAAKEEVLKQLTEAHNNILDKKITEGTLKVERDVLADVERQFFYEAILILNFKHKESSAQRETLQNIAKLLGIKPKAHEQLEKLAVIEDEFAEKNENINPSFETDLDKLLVELDKDKINKQFRRMTLVGSWSKPPVSATALDVAAEKSLSFK